MKEQKATLIPIVQQIRLNSQNELVKRTTKGDSADGQAQNPSVGPLRMRRFPTGLF